MILKKPYAFLIRHFKLIHIILSLPLIYIVRKSRAIVTFFNDYVSNSYTFQTGSDISGLYISSLMLFGVFIIIVASLTIYFLLKYKEKPVKMYVSIIIYYIFLFIVLFWLSGIISSMSRDVLSAKAARSYRDISLLIYYPQYIFIIFVVLRAVGFNIKQFNFRTDLKELEITSQDNEEVEVGFELDGYKTKRFLRRFKREFSYYLIENKFMITVVVIIFIFSSLIIYYKTRQSYNTTYTQSDTFVHQGFSIKVMDSIITNLSYNGKEISKGHYYLALKVNAVNNMGKKAKLDYNGFVINVNGKELKPILDRSTYFLDYASPYYGEYIKPDVDKEYALVYEINEKDIKKDFKLKVLSSFYVKSNKLVTNYAVVNLNPVIIDEVINIKQSNIKDKIVFNNTNIGSTIFTPLDYYVGTSYTYDYEHCYTENNCEMKKDIVSVNYSLAKNSADLLVVGYDFDLDMETSYAKHIKNKKSFFGDYITVKARTNGTYKEYNVIDITPKSLTNKVVLQVDGSISGADDIDLYITIRNKRYIVNVI